MDTREVTKSYRLNQWTERIRECRSSGQTVAAWCASHDVNPKSYYYWLRRVRMAACEALPSISDNNSPFVPVKISVQSGNPSPAEQGIAADVVLRFGSATLEIRNTASSALIENTLRALQYVR